MSWVLPQCIIGVILRATYDYVIFVLIIQLLVSGGSTQSIGTLHRSTCG